MKFSIIKILFTLTYIIYTNQSKSSSLKNNSCQITIENPKQDKCEIKSKTNEEFTIKLKGNITTGHDWYLIDHKTINLKKLTSDADLTYGNGKHSEPDSDLIGAGGYTIFKLKASEPMHNTKIKFEYKRWKQDPAESIECSINIS